MAIGSKTTILREKITPRRRQIFEGRSKILYEGPEVGTFALYFKDTVDSQSNQLLENGALNTRICELLMSRLNDVGIHNHFIRRLNMREHLIYATEPLPFTVTAINIATGEFAGRYGLEDPHPLSKPIYELRYKDKALDNPIISPHHIMGLELGTEEDLDYIFKQTQRANDFLYGQFLSLGYRLAQFSLEFGHTLPTDFSENETLIIIDELTPQTMELIDLNPENSEQPTFPFPHFAHQLAHRLGILKEGGPLDLQDMVIYFQESSDT